MNILIFGSSITWGAWDKEGGWAQRLKSFCDKKALKTNLKIYTAVYCLGVSGDTTIDLLERFDTEVKARIEQEEETLILIEIGANDSQFTLSERRHTVPPEEYNRNLLTLINKAKLHRASIIFIGLTPSDKRVDPTPWTPGKTYRLEFIKKYDEILKKLCQKKQIPYIEVMSKFPEEKYEELLTDGIHPNTEGHRIIFEEVKKYLLEKKLIQV